MLTLRPPLIITARLLPGVRFETFTISVDPVGWEVFIDFHGEAEGTETIHVTDFRPGRLPLDDSEAVRKAMGAFLSFVSAYVEALDYADRTGRKPENETLFPERFAEWAILETDEITFTSLELE